MKQKLRKTILAPVSMLMPLVASAQYSPPTDTGLGGGTITEIVNNLMKWLLYLLGFIGVIGFVIAGILYLTSAGNDDRMEMAKKGMIYSVIGVVVGLIGTVILKAVNSWFGGSNRF
ncbi:MAG: pilin [Patescibacteria group bacterium]|nr:pilin [Patescibacteria group bacterium]